MKLTILISLLILFSSCSPNLYMCVVVNKGSVEDSDGKILPAALVSCTEYDIDEEK